MAKPVEEIQIILIVFFVNSFFCGKGATLVEPAPEVDVGPDPGLPPARQGGEGGVPRGGGEQGRRIELQNECPERCFGTNFWVVLGLSTADRTVKIGCRHSSDLVLEKAKLVGVMIG